MLQIVQNMGSGETELLRVPAPALQRGSLLIRTTHTLISAGTERMLVEFGKASLLQKARQQPEKVRMVLEKVRTDGLMATLDAVRSKLDQPIPLGYCNAGVVLAVGADVTEFKPGDRVVSNGGHASVVSVPKNLCARIPDGVEGEAAAFTVLASIGLQGVRLAQPTLGETVVVTGLGLIGLMTVQLLRAHGCRVIGIDFDERRLELAREFGAIPLNAGDGTDIVAAAMTLTGDRGVDAVLVTASTKSTDPVTHAARMSRKRGRIVLVGVTGLEINRADFYEKELTFQVSCSYGPGRYDPAYESGGQDYPLAFVRWTEQRNFEAILALMADDRLNVARLISRRFTIDRALEAYDTLTSDATALGIVLGYPDTAATLPRRVVLPATQPEPAQTPASPVVGFIGAGNYASRILIPAFKAAGARLDTLVTNTGASAVHHGRKAGFAVASTQADDVLGNAAINVVAIATRHDTHAGLAVRALDAGKHVFVEKPLALTFEELAAIEAARARALQKGRATLLMVGFNRRFAPMVVKMKSLLRTVSAPKAISYTCNASAIPASHWTQDRRTGGGRILGEACHFIDLIRHLVGAPIVDSTIMTMGNGVSGSEPGDKAIISLKFADGSIGTIQYFANGGKAFPKERIEVFAGNAVLQLDNFVVLRGFGWPGFTKLRSWRQDKGQQACASAFIDAVGRGTPAPIALEELLEVARVSIELTRNQVHESVQA